jgi:hypothetical protein
MFGFKKGSLLKLSNTNAYVARDFYGLTVIVLKAEDKESCNPNRLSKEFFNGFSCYVLEKREKFWFYNYQLEDAKVLCR